MTVYVWDEVSLVALGWPQTDPPEGLADQDILLLADARITVECWEGLQTRNHKTRNEDGVMVLDANFGDRNHVTRLYICLEDDERARTLANEELDRFIEEN